MLFTEPGAAAVKTVQSSVYVGISVYHIAIFVHVIPLAADMPPADCYGAVFVYVIPLIVNLNPAARIHIINRDESKSIFSGIGFCCRAGDASDNHVFIFDFLLFGAIPKVSKSF